jgi:hypothetical protein
MNENTGFFRDKCLVFYFVGRSLVNAGSMGIALRGSLRAPNRLDEANIERSHSFQ